MPRIKLKLLALSMMAASICLPVQAAGTATIATNGEISQFRWLNDGTARFDMPAANEGYMVLQNGKVYMVNPDAADGMPQVMEMGGMMQDMAQAFAKDSEHPFGQIESAESTGKEETIAGVIGEVFDVTITDAEGNTQTRELVLTNDPQVVEMTAAYMSISTAMLGQEAAKFLTGLPGNKRGLLRSGDDMTLQSVSADKPSAELFQLPSEPIDMGDMMKQLMQQMQDIQ